MMTELGNKSDETCKEFTISRGGVTRVPVDYDNRTEEYKINKGLQISIHSDKMKA